MANTSRVSPIRIEKLTLQRVSIPDYSSVSSLEEDCRSTESEDMSTSPDTSYRSSADADKSFDPEEDFRNELVKFDDIIEKIENLRFVRNINHEDDSDKNEEDEDANENVGKKSRRVAHKNVNNVEYRDTCELRTNRRTDNEDINNNEDHVTAEKNQSLNTDEEPRDKGRRRPQEDQDSDVDEDEESEQERQQKHEDDSDDSDLIERGPIKPDFQPLREHPYSMVSWLSRANDNLDTVHAVDYDKTAELILRNKDYSEKMNSCLDQLSNSSRNQLSIGAIVGGLTMNSGWTGENTNNSVFRNGEPGSDVSALYTFLSCLVIDNLSKSIPLADI